MPPMTIPIYLVRETQSSIMGPGDVPLMRAVGFVRRDRITPVLTEPIIERKPDGSFKTLNGWWYEQVEAL